MGRGPTVALAAAAAALLVSLPMLTVSLRAADPYEQETRRMFVEWKARVKETYRYVGEEPPGATTIEEFNNMFGARMGEKSYEQETRRMFVGWKAKYGKTYRDVGEEECRYELFKGNRRVVVRLNAAAGQNVYGLNQFGDLTTEGVRERCYPKMEDRELSARCQADPDSGHGRLIRYKVCRCIATELKETESGGSAIPGDGLMVLLLQQLMQMHGV
ncbi:unnamed protein product [Miscanthus lutarioriparius]|uniref:Cathepsin propeptide inhibitor domain-containing protein n=1 Tax=Miscanthus lutarioriparius TaxID=422564 RepID=A0A811S422_9POAL|nr:unnamed protein product [Miscanthus lutarioriparius]